MSSLKNTIFGRNIFKRSSEPVYERLTTRVFAIDIFRAICIFAMHLAHIGSPISDYAEMAKTSTLFKLIGVVGTFFASSRGYFFAVSGALGGYRVFSAWIPLLFRAASSRGVDRAALHGAYKKLAVEMVVLVATTCLMWPILVLIEMLWDMNLEYYWGNYGAKGKEALEYGKSGFFRSSFYFSPNNTPVGIVPIVSCICIVFAAVLVVAVHALTVTLRKRKTAEPTTTDESALIAYPTYAGAFAELKNWFAQHDEALFSVLLAAGLLIFAVVIGAVLRAPVSYANRKALDNYVAKRPQYELDPPGSCATTTLQCSYNWLHKPGNFLFDAQNPANKDNHRPCFNTKGDTNKNCSASNIHWNTWFFLYFINSWSGDMAGVWPHITYYFGGMVAGLVYAVTVANLRSDRVRMSIRAKTQFMWMMLIGSSAFLFICVGIWYLAQVQQGEGFYARYAKYHNTGRSYPAIHNNAWPFRLPLWFSTFVYKDGEAIPAKMIAKYNIPHDKFSSVSNVLENGSYQSGCYAIWQTAFCMIWFAILMYICDFSYLARRINRKDDQNCGSWAPFWSLGTQGQFRARRVPLRWFRRASTYSLTIFLVDYYVYPAISAIGGHLMATEQDIAEGLWGGTVKGRFAYWNFFMTYIIFYFGAALADLLFAGFFTWDWAFGAVQRIATTFIVSIISIVTEVIKIIVKKESTPEFWTVLGGDIVKRLRPIIEQPPRRNHAGIKLVNTFDDSEALDRLMPLIYSHFTKNGPAESALAVEAPQPVLETATTETGITELAPVEEKPAAVTTAAQQSASNSAVPSVSSSEAVEVVDSEPAPQASELQSYEHSD